MRPVIGLLKKVEDGMRDLVSRSSGAPDPLQLYPKILDELEAQIAAGPNGRIWPWNRVTIRVRAASDRESSFWQQTFGALDEDFQRRLRALNCTPPPGVSFHWELVDQIEGDLPFEVVGRFERPKHVGRPEVCCLEFDGGRGPRSIPLESRIWIGRLKEARLREQRKVVRNQIVIEHPTIGRSHAVIERSAEGVWILRHLSRNSTTRVKRQLTHFEIVPLSRFQLEDGDSVYLCSYSKPIRFVRRPATDSLA